MVAGLLFAVPAVAAPHWAPARSPAVPGASGYVTIPGAAVPPTPATVYRAIFDARMGAESPEALVPALDQAGSELNALAAEHVPLRNAKFVVVFHGAAMDGLLDDAHYRAKHHVANPNLPVIRDMKKAGVALYVCGQNLAGDGIDPATLTPDVAVASDALIVLMTYQARGYSLLSF
jgi:intracellular sulfur oxidation DsrE/DsrF family protein